MASRHFYRPTIGHNATRFLRRVAPNFQLAQTHVIRPVGDGQIIEQQPRLVKPLRRAIPPCLAPLPPHPVRAGQAGHNLRIPQHLAPRLSRPFHANHKPQIPQHHTSRLSPPLPCSPASPPHSLFSRFPTKSTYSPAHLLTSRRMNHLGSPALRAEVSTTRPNPAFSNMATVPT